MGEVYHTTLVRGNPDAVRDQGRFSLAFRLFSAYHPLRCLTLPPLVDMLSLKTPASFPRLAAFSVFAGTLAVTGHHFGFSIMFLSLV